jgi:hypothetical protein
MIMTANDFFDNLLTGKYPLANLLIIIMGTIIIFIIILTTFISIIFLFRKTIFRNLMKKLDVPTRSELKNEFFHLHQNILILAKGLGISDEYYKRLYDNATESTEKRAEAPMNLRPGKTTKSSLLQSTGL